MKKLAIIAAAASALIGGCAYDAPVTEGGAYYQGSGYYANTPAYSYAPAYPTYSYGPQYTYSYPYSGPYYQDRDRDGTPDAYDRRPNNPYRR
jgi:hypothetical protein